MTTPKQLLAVLLLAIPALATDYYVDATGGLDTNDGLTTLTAWQTLTKVNGATLAAGDRVLFKRGETWIGSLVPPASGTAGNYIGFDAYGSGAPPLITSKLPVASGSWSVDSGNIWKATLTQGSMNFVLFSGSIWGNKKTGAKTDCIANYDWYFSSNTLYVYATANPVTYYGAVAAMANPSGQVLYINGKSYLNVQHLKFTYFDAYGIRIGGASDHVNIANVYVDGLIPNGVLPHGVYSNATAPTDINLYGIDAHRGYTGFRFDGAPSGTPYHLVNCRAFTNRAAGLVDNTTGTNHVAYSYSHFYANNIGIFGSQDVSGGVDGGHNIAADTPPQVLGFQRYPARISVTVDDEGKVDGGADYIDTLLPEFASRGMKLSIGVITGEAYAADDASRMAGWVAAGHDVNSHSWSHNYFTQPNAFTIQYTGTGSAATMTISGNHLTTSVTGGPGGENLDLDLTGSAYDEMTKLVGVINGRGGYTASLVQSPMFLPHTHSITLTDVAAQAIKASAYTATIQKDRFVPDEMATSKAWLAANVEGFSSNVYVYPSGIQDSTTWAWAVAAGYTGGRGALSMSGSNQIYSTGVNEQNVTSLGLGVGGLTREVIVAKMIALAFKASVWGAPYGLFLHPSITVPGEGDLTPAEMGASLDGLRAGGAQVMTNTQLFGFLNSQPQQDASTFRFSLAGNDPDFRIAQNSPDTASGSDLGSSYNVDLNGSTRTAWEIGSFGFNEGTPVISADSVCPATGGSTVKGLPWCN